MLLCALDIDGTPINDITVPKLSDMGANPKYKAEASLPSGYLDISTIENWEKYGPYCFGQANFNDWKKLRAEIKALVDSIGWGSLTDPQKEIASEYHTVGQSDRDSVHTIDEQIAHGLVFHSESVRSRIKRRNYATTLLKNYLDKADNDEVIDDMRDSKLLSRYTDFGREGTVEGDPEGLFDYIDARAGTTWASGGGSPGLRAKGFTPTHSLTMDQLADKVLDKLKNDKDG